MEAEKYNNKLTQLNHEILVNAKVKKPPWIRLTGIDAGKVEEQAIAYKYIHSIVSENWCEVVSVTRYVLSKIVFRVANTWIH